MTTIEIADALNRNVWYKKRDCSLITAYQVHGRTKSYPWLFQKCGSMVALAGSSLDGMIKVKAPKVAPASSSVFQAPINIQAIDEVLVNEIFFKSAGIIDDMVPSYPGLYCIRIRSVEQLPSIYGRHLYERKHNILYIGVATGNLFQRFLNQELRANGHGTFFRSIGAVLGFRPLKGSLAIKKNKRNYRFNVADEEKIIKWINANLLVNWVEFNGNFDAVEKALIRKHLPLFNISGNPQALRELSNCRAECVRIANEP